MVKCQVCGNFYRYINNAHLAKHGLTPKEYDRMFPGVNKYDLDARVRLGGSNKNNNINHNLFDSFTPENCWLIGLITSDGSFSRLTHPTNVLIYSTNLPMLQKAEKVLEGKNKISSNQDIRGRMGHKRVYTLRFSSVKITHFLKSINCYRLKETRNPFNFIPDNMKRHFIRGLFDGDGNIYKNSKTGRTSFSIAGRFDLINNVYDWLCKKLNMSHNKIYHHKGTPTYYFSVSSLKDTRNIFEFLYKDSKDCFNEEKYNYFKKVV